MFKIKKLFIILVICLTGCGPAGFSGDDRKDDKKDGNDSDNSKDSGDNATEPVMVGGSYLSCFSLNDQNQSVQGDVGCAVKSKATHQKMELSEYDLQWKIRRGKNPITVPQAIGAPADSFHQRFIFGSMTIQDLMVDLHLEKAGQGMGDYAKSLQTLDEAPGGMQLAADAAYGVNLCSGVDCLTKLVESQFSPCINGKINPTAMVNPNLTSKKTLNKNDPPVQLNRSGQCVIRTDQLIQFKTLPAYHLGCLLVPVRQKDGKMIMYVTQNTADDANTKKLLSELERHRCVGN